MSTLKILSDINCTVRCDFKEVGNIQAGELYKLQLKKGCYILEFLVEDIVICSMDYTIETNDEEPLLRLNIKEQAGKRIREQKFIRNKSTNVNIYPDDDRYILDCEANNPIVIPKGYDLYYKSIDGQYIEDEAGYLPFRITIVEERIENGETNKSEKTLYGSLNKLGEIVIRPINNTPVIFYNSEIARTARNKCLIHVNHYGEEIALSYLNTDCFDIIAPLDKKDNLFIAKSTEDTSCLGVVRYDKKIIVSLSNKTIYKNTGDYIWALKGDTLSIYNNEGKWIRSIHSVDLGEIELPYRRKHQDYVFVHKENEAVAVRVSGYWGLYDFDGNTIFSHIYEQLDTYWIDRCGLDHSGNYYGNSPLMFVKKKNGGYGIININVFDNSDGIRYVDDIKEIIPCKYDAIFSNDGKRIELLKENFFQWEEQCDDGSSVEHGIGDNIFFVKHQENLLECDYFYIEMLSFGEKDKEEHFVCKEFNQYQYIDEDGNPHLRGNNRDQSSCDKEELINTSRHAIVFSEDGISIIGCDETFEGDLIVPEGIRYIREHAFVNSKLTSVYIPNSVTSIGTGAFRCCRSLTSVTIGNSVESIGDSAFEGCDGLASITIGNSVIGIGSGAFRSCKNLTSITIPNSVAYIGRSAFEDCDGLTSVHISDIAAWCRINFSNVFSNPLYFVQHLFLNGEEIKDLVLPNSVKRIGYHNFLYCRCLTSITIPSSVKFIGDTTFSEWEDLTSIVVEEGNTQYDSRNNCNAIIETSSNRLIAGCKNTTIPNSVKSIGNYAFRSCNGLTSITIPNSVTFIGDFAFCGCWDLTSIVVEEGNIRYDSRHNCNAIIETLSNKLIVGCKNTTIPNSVKSIGNYAFAYCSDLISVAIPNSVTSIGSSAFEGCDGLTSITIPNSVIRIGDRVFLYCDNLKEIIIPKGTRKKFEEMLPDQKDKLVEQGQMAKKETKDRLLFFDTETTGVPLNYKASSSDTQNWPRLVQLAWVLTDEEGNRIHVGNLIVKPEGFIIPTDAIRVHGITTQRANEEGVSLAEVIEQFKADLDVANYIVGHNVDFDKKIVGAEMIRLGLKDIMDSKKSYCTMQSSIDFCKIPGKYGYKYPKLQELYKKLFGTEFDNAHDAMNDIEATEKCFWELRKRNLI